MYDSDTSTVTAALKSSNTAVFTDETISKILALTTKSNSTVTFDKVTADFNGNINPAAGSEVVLVQVSDFFETTVTPPANAPVLIFEGKGGVNVTFSNTPGQPVSKPGTTDRIVVGSAGNDHIVVADAKNTQITLGSGNSTVIAGGGEDTVVAGLGNSTIVGSNGRDVMAQLKGNATDYNIKVVNGAAVVQGANGHTTTLEKVQYVKLDNGDALVIAKDAKQAAVAAMYEATFGRGADKAGLEYWFDVAAKGDSLISIAKSFTNSIEYAQSTAKLDNNAFLEAVYMQTLGRAADAEGKAYWADQLAHGASRADMLAAFANVVATEAGTDTHVTEPTVIGSIKIVHNII